MNSKTSVTVKEIYDYIDSIAPFATAMDFDNVGILVGHSNTIVKRVLCVLDITKNAVNEAIKCGAELIVSHHPVIFDPIKSVLDDSVVFDLCRSGISAICAHTNLDAAPGGVNDVLCKILELKDVTIWEPEKIGRIGYTDLSVEEMALRIAEKLKTKYVNYVNCGKRVRKVAVMSGSGGGDIDNAISSGADTLVTGEVKHSQYIKAKCIGLNVIVAGHFDTEYPIIPVLAEYLSYYFKNLDIKLYREPSYETLIM